MLILQVILAFTATLFFAIIFNAPKGELIFCGLTGAVGWLLYLIVSGMTDSSVFATFVAAVAVTISSRYLSHFRYAPSTLYLIPGIIPLVPGAGVYYTMFELLNGEMYASYVKGIETLKLAGAIALGIIVILALPYSIFTSIKLGEKKKSE